MAEQLLTPEYEASLHASFQFVPVGICAISNDRIIKVANPHLTNISGFHREELLNHNINFILPEIDNFINEKQFVAGTKAINSFLVRKNRSRLPVEVRVSPGGTKNQERVLFITDVSDKKSLDERFKIIFYKSPAAKILSEFETGKIVETNDNFCRFSGYSKYELIGKTPVELKIISAETRAQWMTLLHSQGRISNLEVQLSTRLSDQVYALLSSEQIEIGGRKFLLSTCIDITNLKQTHAALENAKLTLESEAAELTRLNDAGTRLWKINNLEDGLEEILSSSIELTRADKADIQFYDAGRQILVLKATRGFSKKFQDYFREVSISSHSSTCAIALRNQSQFVTIDTELEWTPEDAAIARNENIQSAQSTPLQYHDRTPMGMISTHFSEKGTPPPLVLRRMKLYALVAETFIERMQFYDTIRATNIELEEKVAQRTSELIAALDHEKELNDMKSRFVSMASHEFRTPLTAMLSSISLVKAYHHEDNLEKRNKHILRIQNSIASLIDILNDFLSIEKLQQGNISMTYQDFDLHEFAIETMEELKGVLKKGQAYNFSYNGDKQVTQDKKVLTNVLRNLLSNAAKYSDEEKSISLFIKVIDDSVCIEVKDEGIGISEEEQKHIFSSFFRAKNAVNIQGTGLGLSIVKRYMELLNGTIEFESALNNGTTFTVSFPKNGGC